MEESRKRPQLPELPWDVWVNILSRLPVKSILQGRSVCKGWRLLLAHPHFTKVHSHRLQQYPALLYFNNSTRCLTHVEIIGDGSNGGVDITTTTQAPSSSAAVMELRVKDYPELNPVATCNGVVCFCCGLEYTGNTPYYVGNPLVDRVQEFARVEQPQLTRNPQHEGPRIQGFGLSLKTKRYKIVAFYLPACIKVDGQVDVKICTVVPRWELQDNWRNIGPFPRGSRPFPYHHGHDIGSYFDGGIHWLLLCSVRRYPTLISRLDLDSEQFEWLPTPESEDFQSAKRLSLVVSGGHLMIFAVGRYGCCRTTDGTMSIWVRIKESWMKKFVVKEPGGLTWCRIEKVKVLSYGRWADEAAGRREAAEVLFYSSTSRCIFLYGREDQRLTVFPYVPSLLSIYDDRLNFKRPTGATHSIGATRPSQHQY